MKNIKLISDFSVKEIPFGGAERVDDALARNLNASLIKTNDIKEFDPHDFYILSNISRMPSFLLEQVTRCQYILLEHDSKYCLNRNPWLYKECIVPKDCLINLNLYRHAKVVLVQTTDHLSIFRKNGIEANFFNLKSSLWQNEDLELLREILCKRHSKINKAVIYNSDNWIKNTIGAIQFCKTNSIDFELLGNQNSRRIFLENLGKYNQLVFFPKARETFCRLVVEARCLNLRITTTNNYGAVLEDWFRKYHGEELINFLQESNIRNMEEIKRMIGD